MKHQIKTLLVTNFSISSKQGSNPQRLIKFNFRSGGEIGIILIMSMGNKVVICNDEILGLLMKIRKAVMSMGSKAVMCKVVMSFKRILDLMHGNELFESYSTEEGVVLKDIRDVYRALDAGLQDGGSAKDKGRTQVTSEVAVLKAISSIVKNIFCAHAHETGNPLDLNVQTFVQSSSCQDSWSFDTSDLSSSNIQHDEWQEVTNKKKKKKSDPILLGLLLGLPSNICNEGFILKLSGIC